MGKFHKIFAELSACDTIMAGYYSLMFLFFSIWKGYKFVYLHEELN